MIAAALPGTALIAIVAAMLLVRIGWSGRRRVAIGGWALGLGTLALLAAGDGAWGIAIGTVAGMATALACVLVAGWRSPVRHSRPHREPPSVTLPQRPAALAQRVAVFALVVPVAAAAAQWLAYGAQAAARHAGAGESDATVLMLFLQPLWWSGLMAWQMTRPGPRAMMAAPAGTAALGTLFWSLS